MRWATWWAVGYLMRGGGWPLFGSSVVGESRPLFSSSLPTPRSPLLCSSPKKNLLVPKHLESEGGVDKLGLDSAPLSECHLCRWWHVPPLSQETHYWFHHLCKNLWGTWQAKGEARELVLGLIPQETEKSLRVGVDVNCIVYAYFKSIFTIQSCTWRMSGNMWAPSIFKMLPWDIDSMLIGFRINWCSPFFFRIVKTADTYVWDVELVIPDLTIILLERREWSSSFEIELIFLFIIGGWQGHMYRSSQEWDLKTLYCLMNPLVLW